MCCIVEARATAPAETDAGDFVIGRRKCQCIIAHGVETLDLFVGRELSERRPTPEPSDSCTAAVGAETADQIRATAMYPSAAS